MLQRLNAWKTGCSDGVTCASGKCADGTACAAEALTSTDAAVRDRVTTAMKSEIEIVDYMRQLYAIYGAIGAGN